MSPSESDRITRLERRIQTLEDRLTAMAPAEAAAPVGATQTVATSAVMQPAPTLPAPTASAAAPARTRSFADLEEQLSSRLLAWVGGIALVLGAMFFLSLAFSRGWIGPEARVLI